MAALSFIHNANPNIVAIYFDHGTAHGEAAQRFVADYCRGQDIQLITGALRGSGKPPEDSWEEYWRHQRYAFLATLTDHRIAVAHHLNDAVETYLWGCFHGQPRLIHYQSPLAPNVVRPFLLTPKAELINWCQRRDVPFIVDESNKDLRFARNRIRHQILPEVEKVNPGILKVVKKMLLQQQEEQKHR
jgi:tRNA(Ile)-lysidine synthase